MRGQVAYASSIFVVVKALRSGYYWPTMHTDTRKLIRECSSCQVHRDVPRNQQQNLTTITSPWPFYKWRIDTVEPFLEGPGKVKFLIVTIDYFTKWIEAKPVATITGAQIKKFAWDNIAHRTMIKSSNEETPFSLTYGTKTVILVEISMPTLRTVKVDMIKNNEALEINLDLLEDKREQAAIHEAKRKAMMENTIMIGFATQVLSQKTSSI
nr:gypsy retrotransposon integrase-like protein 1 [Tanacetum cinerariifolium]GEW36752.1 gypsy retrotransposon integrase-like protein 1 [Tanacetum cinerariifolium]